MPDIRFLEKERKNLVGLVLTHAHEDHFARHHRPVAEIEMPDLCDQFRGPPAVRSQMCLGTQPAEDSGTVAGGLADGRSWSLQRRIHSARIRFRNPTRWRSHVGRHGSSHRRLENRSDADYSAGPPTSAVAGAGRRRRAGADRRLTNAVREGRSPSEAEAQRTIAEW